MNWITRFKSLPKKSRTLLSIGILFALVVALPLFVWAIVTQKFLIFQRAASGEPTVTYGKPIHWSTAYVQLDASDFWITVNGKKFMGTTTMNISSDPGSATYTTLEAIWNENGVEMRMFLYFAADSQNWWLREARIYNGNERGDWVYIITDAQVFKRPLGTPFEEGLMYGLVKNDSSGHVEAEIQFQNLTIQGFANRTANGNVICSQQPPQLSVINGQNSNPGPGSSAAYTIVLKNRNSGLCSNPYTDMPITFNPPANGWTINLPITHAYTTAGGTMSINVSIYNPPNTQTNQMYYPSLDFYDPDISQSQQITIPYYVQYYGGPTPTPPAGSCGGKPNGTGCNTSNYVCVACVSGQPCPSPNCYYQPGVCQNGQCIAQLTPTPTPSARPGVGECQMCGGIRGLMCQSGLTCKYSSVRPPPANPYDRSATYPDQSGICVKQDGSSSCPTNSPSPNPYVCGQSCQTNYQCASGLICYQGLCKNPGCVSDASCSCTSTPPPTVRPFQILFKMSGVNDDSASYQKLGDDRAKVNIKFSSPALNYDLGLVTGPLPVDYIGNGIYAMNFGIWSSYLPVSNDYAISLKGEKHLSTKFCFTSGQSSHCSGRGQIALPQDPRTKLVLNFTGIPLQPGDLYPQDGSVSILGANSDLSRLLVLLAKPPNSLTTEDLLVGDLDYNRVINIRDLFLLRQALLVRYDDD